MRRFATTSITMLAGLVIAPACGAVLGIDTDRPVVDDLDAASPSPSSTSSTSSSGSSSSGEPGEAGGTPGECGTGCGDGECVNGECVFRCGPAKCTKSTVFACPEGVDCRVECGIGALSCKDVTCRGGRSCTFACQNGDCRGTTCESAACIFQCSNNSCGSNDKDLARCTDKVTTCEVECPFGPSGLGKACLEGVCCEDPTECKPRENDCDG
ncbi:MAG: hypothetical protein KIT84_14505 [Labilithrix sp.]|nr:hypothetical protein [Labilithrix sp.]MCW5812233.1 hypothetical protein [Labilithrix sp.]